MPDLIFEHPRLVAIYDAFDGPRRDLPAYLSLAKELKANTILDIGCGTGCFALLAASQGFEVIGLEPSHESLKFAKTKPNAEKVNWIQGTAKSFTGKKVDLAVMTGNVAQVFLSDQEWEETLSAVRNWIAPGGHFVFEVRDPAQKAWLDWTPERTFQREEIPGVGSVEGWCEVTEVIGELVTFRWTYTFASDGEILHSNSTLRFRSRERLARSLREAGFGIREVRDAPDRPGKEFVFIAGKAVNS